MKAEDGGIVIQTSSTDEDVHEWQKIYGRAIIQFPEQRLLLAMLEDAVEVLKMPRARSEKENEKRQRLKHEVMLWIESDDYDYALSFSNCCESLKLNPSGMRRMIKSHLS